MTRVLLPARCGAVPAHLVLRVLVALQCVRSEAWSGIKMSALNPMANIQGAFCVMHPLRACAVWQGVEACALWHGVCGMVCVAWCVWHGVCPALSVLLAGSKLHSETWLLGCVFATWHEARHQGIGSRHCIHPMLAAVHQGVVAPLHQGGRAADAA